MVAGAKYSVMANIKFGNGWADARGKVGGVIYSKNKGGSYARNYTKPTNPRTPAQVAQRNRFAYVSSNWRLLDDNERNAWNYAASQVPVSNKVGERINLSGAQYFNRQNLQIFSGGGTAIVTSPSALIDIVGLVSLTVTATVTAGVVTALTFAGVLVDGTSVIPTGRFMPLYATPTLSAGVTRPQPSQYVNLGDYGEGDSIATLALLGEYTANFPLMAEGANVWVKAKIVDELTGQTSQELEAKVVYVNT